MSSIFNIQKEYAELLERLEEQEGELTPELEQALQINQEELEVKAQGYAVVIRKLDADLDVVDAEIKRLQEFKKSKQNQVDRLKTAVRDAMLMYGIHKIESATSVLSLRKSESVEILDESSIPKEYIREKITTAPDKVAIKKALESGKALLGAQIKTNQNLQIK